MSWCDILRTNGKNAAMKVKTLPVFILLAVSSAGSASAQRYGGKIALYSDTLHTDTTLADTLPGDVKIYVVHEDRSNVSTSAFMVVASEGFTGTWLGETSAFFTVGDSETGIFMSYGGCRNSPILILTITYQVFGTSSQCAYLSVEAHPVYGWIEVLNCDMDLLEAIGQTLTVNCTVSVEETTWGRIKSIYR
jgi:hypothetical protein